MDEDMDIDDTEQTPQSGITDQELANRNWTIYVTTDNASNISKAVEESPFEHVRCFAHTINLSVKKGLEVGAVKSMLSDIREVVKYFKKSSKAKYALEVSFCYV